MTDLEMHVNHIADELKKVYAGSIKSEEYEDEPMDFYEFFKDVYDVEYTVDSNKEFKAVSLLVAFGGPNIYVDTNTGTVRGYWWTEHAEAWIPKEICDAINDVFSEIYACI